MLILMFRKMNKKVCFTLIFLKVLIAFPQLPYSPIFINGLKITETPSDSFYNVILEKYSKVIVQLDDENLIHGTVLCQKKYDTLNKIINVIWRDSFTNAVLQKGQFIYNGIPIGRFVTYCKKDSAVCYFNKGKKEGIEISNHGSLQKQYKNGVLNGLTYTFHNLYIQSVKNYSNGKLDGEYLLYKTRDSIYYLAQRIYFNNGKFKNGKSYFIYNNDGSVLFEYFFKNDKLKKFIFHEDFGVANTYKPKDSLFNIVAKESHLHHSKINVDCSCKTDKDGNVYEINWYR